MRRTEALTWAGSQLVGVDHARQAEVGGELAPPHSGRFAGAQVVVGDPKGDLTNQVLGVGQLGDPQHGRVPILNGQVGKPRPEGWQMCSAVTAMLREKQEPLVRNAL